MLKYSLSFLALFIIQHLLPAQKVVVDRQQHLLPAPKMAVDMQQFLKRQDPVWDTTHTYFYEGAFIGNGLEGAMVYREDSNALRWDINRTDLTAPSNNPEYTRARFGVGKYVLRPQGKILSSAMRIDLWNGRLIGNIKTTKGTVDFVSYVHHKSKVMVTEFVEKGEKITFQYVPEEAKVIKAYQWIEATTIYEYPANKIEAIAKNNVQISRQQFKEDKTFYEVAHTEIATATKRTFFSAIGTNVTFSTDTTSAYNRVTKAINIGEANLYKTHQEWWHLYYQKTFVSIPDARLESFYWIQLYKLASSLRADGPMLDLMGPWFAHTPWPAIWWNLNVQLTYSPLYSLNQLAMGETLYRTLDKNIANLITNAPEPFRHNSAGIGRVTTNDLKGEVNLLNSKFPYYDKEPGNLQWVMHNYFLQYRYSMNDSMLQHRIFPLLKRSTNLYLNILVKDANGKYHLPETFSPEYALTKDANYDLSLLKWGCQTLLFINQKFGLQDTLSSKWNDVFQNLTPFPTDATGLRIGADTSLATSHRHFSHLLMIYPLRLMSWNNVAERPLIQQSVDHWLGLKGGHAGYTYTSAAAINASMGRGDSALKYLNVFLDYLPANTLYREAGPVIETPYAAVNSIHQMLLQSHGEYLNVFPAVPKTWADASFHELRAEGAFLVSAQRKQGKTQWISIESLEGSICKIKLDFDMTKLKIKGKLLGRFKIDQNNVVTIDLKKGEKITLSQTEIVSDLSAVISNGKPNYYGMKFKKKPIIKK